MERERARRGGLAPPIKCEFLECGADSSVTALFQNSAADEGTESGLRDNSLVPPLSAEVA